MESDMYSWDTRQQQEAKKPYSFRDYSRDFMIAYHKRRKRVLEEISKPTEIFRENDQRIYSDKDLENLNEFNSEEVILTLYKAIQKEDGFNKSELRHFWKLLKKIELRKLRKSYNKNFENTSREEVSNGSFAFFALTLGEYTKSKKNGYLQALSTLLKANDLLVSRKEEFGPLEKTLLLTSLQTEIGLVEDIHQRIKERKAPDIETNNRRVYPAIVLPKLGMVLQETNRSKAYLQNLIMNGLLPNFVYILRGREKEVFDSNPPNLESSFFNPYISEEDSLKVAGIPYRILKASSFNDPIVVETIKQRHEEYFIFSGSGILKEIFDSRKKFVHAHPGKLPEYRGSTCFYYSALAEDRWTCTAFIMSPRIDEGEIITSKEFPLPTKKIDPARVWDPYTRSEVLVNAVRPLVNGNTIRTTKQDLSTGVVYYIIHPVLRHLAQEKFQKE